MPPAHTPELIGSLTDLTLDLVKQSVEARKLQLDENILASAVSALRAGKHLILTGPPGTGKTELAFALCDAAAEADIAAGTLTTTATADWTSIETVGGYRLDSSRNLTFSPGVFVQAIDRKAWLVVDEFNRADIDKAIGQIFTVLSGQAITLPYSERKSGVEAPVSIVPAGEAKPVGTHEYRIDPRWRIIATLNSRDRDLLFNMSYALLRRFAIIDIPTPSKAVSLAILKIKAP